MLRHGNSITSFNRIDKNNYTGYTLDEFQQLIDNVAAGNVQNDYLKDQIDTLYTEDNPRDVSVSEMDVVSSQMQGYGKYQYTASQDGWYSFDVGDSQKNVYLKAGEDYAVTVSGGKAIAEVDPEHDVEKEEDEDIGIVQETLTEIGIEIGDYALKFLHTVLGEEVGNVTIDGIVFNRIDSLNPNFFDKSVGENVEGGTASIAGVVRDTINKWYAYFRGLAIAVYIMAVIMVAIRVFLEGTAISKVKAKDVITKWTLGVAMLFLFPYLMKMAFELNEAVVDEISKHAFKKENLGLNIGGENAYSDVEIEFRSPEYVSKYTGEYGNDANEYYESKMDEYASSGDMMRFMRACAGATNRFVYVILWYIMMYQLIVLIVKYYKRYFVIAILITIFPIVLVYYVIELCCGRNSAVFGTWCREFFVNVFIQMVHAIIYSLIVSVVLEEFTNSAEASQNLNWIFMLVAITFLFTGESILKKILGVGGASTMPDSADTAKTGKSKYKSARGNLSKIGE